MLGTPSVCCTVWRSQPERHADARHRQALPEFYEHLGETVANELVDWFNAVNATHRADLRELDELNLHCFDAKFEQRLTQFDAEWERRSAELDASVDRRLGALKADLMKWMFIF